MDDLPFTDPPDKRCCGTCDKYNGYCCMREWNNLDPVYYVPERDDRDEMDSCDDWSGEYGYTLEG